ncbi:hypothetical protein ACH5AL_12780 [Actinacidiphila glaucinigra]|uniref:hypothetical protein n=1 Tax=Actinacidiphila glaucinigra TaxID=235986 RepID=UPI0037AABFC5
MPSAHSVPLAPVRSQSRSSTVEAASGRPLRAAASISSNSVHPRKPRSSYRQARVAACSAAS